jgi:hypothetical protein
MAELSPKAGWGFFALTQNVGQRNDLSFAWEKCLPLSYELQYEDIAELSHLDPQSEIMVEKGRITPALRRSAICEASRASSQSSLIEEGLGNRTFG